MLWLWHLASATFMPRVAPGIYYLAAEPLLPATRRPSFAAHLVVFCHPLRFGSSVCYPLRFLPVSLPACTIWPQGCFFLLLVASACGASRCILSSLMSWLWHSSSFLLFPLSSLRFWLFIGCMPVLARCYICSQTLQRLQSPFAVVFDKSFAVGIDLTVSRWGLHASIPAARMLRSRSRSRRGPLAQACHRRPRGLPWYARASVTAYKVSRRHALLQNRNRRFLPPRARQGPSRTALAAPLARTLHELGKRVFPPGQGLRHVAKFACVVARSTSAPRLPPTCARQVFHAPGLCACAFWNSRQRTVACFCKFAQTQVL